MGNILDFILNERYIECNEKGHLKPDVEIGYCNYCYRHIKNEDLKDYQTGLKKLAEEIVVKLSIIG